LDPASDPQGASYHISQILKAIATGGFFGVGLGGSTGKFNFIPEIQTDAIFAIFVEETGFVGALLLIFAFTFLISRAISIARNASDYQGRVLASGIAALLFTQSFFNIASNVALIPLTGVPLPFISYGGSSLFVTMASIGILLNIKRQS
jgi:cell division protein FtsW